MAQLGDEEWRAHAELIGRLAISWNGCVHQLLRVFRHLTDLPPDLAREIFLSHRSDQGQRHMVKRLAVVVGIDDEPRLALGKILERLDKVSGRRNLAIHTIFGLSLIDPETSTWSPKIAPVLPPGLNGNLDPDFTVQFEASDRDLGTIYRDLETWLVHTPCPARLWRAPALLGEPTPYIDPGPEDEDFSGPAQL